MEAQVMLKEECARSREFDVLLVRHSDLIA